MLWTTERLFARHAVLMSQKKRTMLVRRKLRRMSDDVPLKDKMTFIADYINSLPEIGEQFVRIHKAYHTSVDSTNVKTLHRFLSKKENV